MRSSEAGTCRAAIAPPHVLSCAAYLLRAEMPTYNNNRSSHCYCASSRYGSSYAPWSPSSCYYYSWHSSLSFANNFFAVLTILTSSFSSPSQRPQQQPAAAPAKADNRRRGRSGGGSSRQPQEFFRTITLSIIRYTTTTHFQNECSGSLLCGIQKVAIVAKKGGARTDKIRWLFVEPGLKMLRSKCCNSYTPGDKTGFTYAFQPLVGSQFSLLAGQHAPPPHAGIFSVHRETVAGTGHRVHRKSSQSEKPYIYI